MPCLPSHVPSIIQALHKSPVLVPTETVFGLAAPTERIPELYSIKKRPDNKPIPLMVSSLEKALELIHIPADLHPFLKKVWPGPLTLVGPAKNSKIAQMMNTESLAVRIPACSILLHTLKQINQPLAVSSANISGYISVTRYQHIAPEIFENFPYVCAPNVSSWGLESSVVAFQNNQWDIFRLGGTTLNTLQEFAPTRYNPPPSSPRISWNAHHSDKDALSTLGFGKKYPTHLNLSQQGCIHEAAYNLYSLISEYKLFQQVRVAPLPQNSLSFSIIDAIKRLYHNFDN